MPTKVNAAEQRAARSWLKEQVERFLKDRGAVAVEATIYDWRVETLAGPLLVHVGEGGWVYCRFEDVGKACQHFGVWRLFQHERFNPYSGKFNFDGVECSQAGSEYLYQRFEDEVGELLPRKP